METNSQSQEELLKRIEKLELDNKELNNKIISIENKFNCFQKLTNIGCWEWRFDNNTVWWSEQTYKIFDKSKVDFVPDINNYTLFLEPDDKAVFENFFQDTNSQYDSLNFNVKIITNNSYKYVNIKAELLKDSLENKIAYVGIIIDLTQFYSNEYNSSTSHDYSSVLNTASVAVCLIDKNTNQIVDANSYFLDLMNYSRKDVIGFTSEQLNLWVIPTNYQNAIEILYQEGKLNNYEMQFRKRNGVTGYCLLSLEFIQFSNHSCFLAIIQDITDRKKYELKLIEDEKQLRNKLDLILSHDKSINDFDLEEILDIPTLQTLMDDLYNITHISTAILDLNGRVLIASQWENICFNFHRSHPVTSEFCLESDTHLSRNVNKGEFAYHKCKNNMWDAATPIYIADKHIGTIFVGQFFYDDEVIDYDNFIKQAELYGFNVDDYIDALNKVPKYSQEKVNNIMTFVLKLSEVISNISYSNINLCQLIVEQNELTESLKESEQKIRFIIDNIPLPVFLKDIDSRYVLVNNSYSDFLNLSPNSIIGKTDYDIFEAGIAQRFVEKDKLILKEKQKKTYDEEFIYKRNKFYAITTKTPLINQEGLIYGILGSFLDISQRKIAEEKLRESEDKYSAVFHTSPDAITISTLDGTYVDINEAFTNLTGYTRSDIVGIPNGFKKVWVNPYDRNRIINLVNEFGIAENQEALLTYKDSKIATGLLSAKVFIYNNQPHLLVITKDISERKQVENELESKVQSLTEPIDNSIYKFEDLFNIHEIQQIQDSFALATGVASIITDINGVPITKPSNFCRLCKDIIRKTEKGLKNCYLSDSVICNKNIDSPNVNQCFSGGLWDGGASINAGEQHIANWLIGQVLDDSININSVMSYAIEIGADIDEFSQALKEVKRMSKEQFDQICNALYLLAGQLSKLALQNIQQARLINHLQNTEAELTIAKNKAEESDWLKSAFLANMSHEIRTPMNAILGFSQLLCQTDLDDNEKNEYVQIINRRGQDLLNIINDILDISKIEANQIVIHNSSGDINKLFLEIFSYFHSIADYSENKKFEIRIGKQLPFGFNFVADFSRLKQILNNLIGNAMKFTKNGFIEFGCSIENNNVLFYVKDTGIGISADKIDIIFDRFRQVEDESISRKYSGTGLGLSISKGLLDLMKGRIWVESKENVGSTFYFTIPLIPSHDFLKENQTPNDVVYDWKDKNILVVEDDESNSTYITRLLNKTNVNIVLAADGKSAIQVFKQKQNIHVVLMDIRLPDISGYEATAIIKGMKPDTIVIAQTAYATPDDREKALNSGFRDFISKPINADNLLELLYKYLK